MPVLLTLSGEMPQDEERNGLHAWVDKLADASDEDRVIALVVLDVPKVTKIVLTGQERPTVRILQIEPLGWAAERPDDARRIAELAAARTGTDPLPMAEDLAEGAAMPAYATGPEDDPARAEASKRRAKRGTGRFDKPSFEVVE